MNIKIKTKSFTITAGRGGDADADVNILYDEMGFPYINGRRLKGLLKEAAYNVLIRLGGNNMDLMVSIFGTATQKGKLRFANAILPDSKYKAHILAYNNDEKNGIKISKAQILSKYTSIINQTTIAHFDEKDNNYKGTAKEKSLRKFRAIQPNIVFDWSLDTKNCTAVENALLVLALIELRNIGTRRNRGNGFIKIETENIGWNEIEQYIALIKVNSTNESKNENISETNLDQTKNGFISKQWIFEATNNIILPQKGGDPNTIETGVLISGNTIRGKIASKIIANQSCGKNAHVNPIFFKAILSEDVKFGFGFPYAKGNVFYPLSMQWYYIKNKKKNEKEDIFSSEEKNLKFAPAFVNDEEKVLSISKDIHFHISRDSEKERISGRNLEGEMFYYESIVAGTQYAFELSGPEYLIDYITTLMPTESTIQVGRSANTQYGEMKCIDIKDVAKQQCIEVLQEGEGDEEYSCIETETKKFIITCQSPLIVFNQYGKATPDLDTFKEYIKQFEGATISDIKAVFQLSSAMVANQQWKGGGMEYAAFEAGSAFLITFDQLPACLPNSFSLGEWQYLGFGQCSMKEYSPSSFSLSDFDKDKITIDTTFIQDYINNANNIFIRKKIDFNAKQAANKFEGNLSGTQCNTIILAFEQMKNEKAFLEFCENRKILGKKLCDAPSVITTNKVGDKIEYKLKPISISIQGIKFTDAHKNDWENIKQYWISYFKYVNKKNQNAEKN
ncbi:MAG: hypothetical protein IPP53_07255 [Bacteroidetes bacterium]|nr:hypothetical protein [Bacteroidota bacterium]